MPGKEPITITLLPAYHLKYVIVDAETHLPPADTKLWPISFSLAATDGGSMALGLRTDELEESNAFAADRLWLSNAEVERLGPLKLQLAWPGYVEHEHLLYASRWAIGERITPQVIELHRSAGWKGTGGVVVQFRQGGRPVVPASQRAVFCHFRSIDKGYALDFRFSPDSDGNMTFTALPAGEYSLVTKLGLVNRDVIAPTVRIEPGQAATMLVQFPPLGMLQPNAPNEAVPQFVEVILDTVPAGRVTQDQFAVTFPGGRALMPYLPVGSYSLQVRGGDISGQPIPVQIRADEVSVVNLLSRGN
jgi:hypothetical protein